MWARERSSNFTHSSTVLLLLSELLTKMKSFFLLLHCSTSSALFLPPSTIHSISVLSPLVRPHLQSSQTHFKLCFLFIFIRATVQVKPTMLVPVQPTVPLNIEYVSLLTVSRVTLFSHHHIHKSLNPKQCSHLSLSRSFPAL